LAKLTAVVGGTRTRGAAVLARLAVELAFAVEAAPGALEEQVGAFTTGEFGLRSGITCHSEILGSTRKASRLVRLRKPGLCGHAGDERWSFSGVAQRGADALRVRSVPSRKHQ